METIRILLLFANPLAKERLNLGEEYDAIDLELRLVNGREDIRDRPLDIKLDSRDDVDIHKIREYLGRQEPPDIIHFSGHGEGDSLVGSLGDGTPTEISTVDFATVLEHLAKTTMVMILNACFSDEQAQIFLEYIPIIIGTTGRIEDHHAREFTTAFYSAFFVGTPLEGCIELAQTALPEEKRSLIKVTSRLEDKLSEINISTLKRFREANPVKPSPANEASVSRITSGLHYIPYLRIFLSSPSDVNEERKVALDVIRWLQNRPVFRDHVAFRVIAWDELETATPLRATMTPQEALNEGLPLPAECDIVLVLFWSRMGTPFVHTDGIEYQSGTYWELLNALESRKTETIIYQRTEKRLIEANDTEGQAQNLKLKEFFKSDLFFQDGRAVRGFNSYSDPEDFRKKFEIHFETLVLNLLSKLENQPAPPADTTPALPQIVTVEPEPWSDTRSPFPGLRVFTELDADIYFGRGRETDLLVRRVATDRFVAVLGASGSGKSSLVRAGLIPRLKANAISSKTTISKDWLIVMLKPEEDPFEALASALIDIVPGLRSNDARNYISDVEKFATNLRKRPKYLDETIQRALKDEKAWTEVLIFIDQFEELFTSASEDDAKRFGTMLVDASKYSKLRFVITMRDDFFQRANAYPAFSELLQKGSFSLSTPGEEALRQMIERPAERAEVEFEDGLIDQILAEIDEQPGRLALMAFLLDELYKEARKRTSRKVTKDDYKALGGIQGAIGNRANSVFDKLDPEAQAALPTLTLALVRFDQDGIVTSRRSLRSEFPTGSAVERLVEALEKERLLTASEDAQHRPTVEVAHEALLSRWPRMAELIEKNREFEVLKQKLIRDSALWVKKKKSGGFLYTREQFAVIPKPLLQRAQEEINEPNVQDFLKACIVKIRTQRIITGAIIGAMALVTLFTVSGYIWRFALRLQAQGLNPLIPLESAEAKVGNPVQSFPVAGFSIDQYEVSYGQYRLCVQAGACTRPREVSGPSLISLPAFDDADPKLPVRQVTVYQAAEFCSWIGRRLPTTLEWEYAARGVEGRPWPWGDDAPSSQRVNAPIAAEEYTPLGPVAVDDSNYADGATKDGVMHLVGNMEEWTSTLGICENPYICGQLDDLSDADYSIPMIVRGFGWNNSIPEVPHLGITDQVPSVPDYVPLPDRGFRCAAS